jgi:hypothetical protein
MRDERNDVVPALEQQRKAFITHFAVAEKKDAGLGHQLRGEFNREWTRIYANPEAFGFLPRITQIHTDQASDVLED